MVDERALFDRFHDALDIEPRPGAYERLRTNLTSQPVALRRRPAFRMRFSKMGLRMVAALAAVLIAIALIATFITVHNRAVGGIPAADPHVKAFRALIVDDYSAMNASTSNHCGTIDDTGCAAAVVPVDHALQKWADDIAAFPKVPAQYQFVALALHAHLLDAITDLNSAVAFQKTGDAAGFDLAMGGALYQRAWIDPASFFIEGTFQGAAFSAAEAIANAKRAVLGCVGTSPGPDVLSCSRLIQYEVCDGAKKSVCEADVEDAQTLVQRSLIDLARNSDSDPYYARLQNDLTMADGGLIGIHDALLHGDSAGVNIKETDFSKGMVGADNDLATL